MANRDNPLSYFLTKHILLTVRTMAGYGSALPGGVYKGVGPDNIPYPFAVFAYVSGSDKLALNSGSLVANGGGLLYQIKVVDQGYDEGAAVAAYNAIQVALKAANNTAGSGAYVTGQEEAPVDLPVTERDQVFQQIGGIWRFWVDPL